MMKKKLLALLCVLSTLIGVLALSATANSGSTTEQKFYVGYAMVDINPYEMDENGNIVTTEGKLGYLESKKTYHNIMPVPLRGTSTSSKRLAYGYLLDDNGDNVVDQKDGLKLTCIAVKDGYGNTILMFTMDAIGDMGHTALARNAIVKELGAKYGITADRIMVSGTHGHSSVDLTALSKSLYEDETADVEVEKAGKYTASTTQVDGRTAFNALNEWRMRLTGYWKDVEATKDENGKYTYTKYEDVYKNTNSYFVQAAREALDDLAEATITKGQIEAKAKNGESMVFMRHYISQATNGDLFVTDTFSNSNVGGTFVEHVSDADETLHAISFDFTEYNKTVAEKDQKEPIVLANWRGHPQFSSGAQGRVVSSDYINAYRYQMKETYGYRAAFFQGTGGNTQPTSKIESENWVDGSSLAGGKSYGYRLADVTKACLADQMTMTPVEAGEIKTLQSIYAAKRVTYTQAELEAAQAAIAAYNPPDGEEQTWDGETKPFQYTYTENDVEKTITITCYQQANKIISHYNNQSKVNIDIEIDTILIGPNLAIVTCPGEPQDRYSLQAAEDLRGKLNELGYQEYHRIASSHNDWDNLAEVKNAEYGEPLIFGYTNDHHTYIPNALAYNYNKELSGQYSTQSYGSFMTPLAEGEGERMVANLETMLDIMVNGDKTENCKTEYCEACKEEVIWYPVDVIGTSSQYDHYYLRGNTELGSNISIKSNMCIDLAGYKLHNDRNDLNMNVFNLAAGGNLSIFDSVGTGEVKGSNNGGSGGAISVAADATVNIYGGLIYADGTNCPYGGAIVSNGIVNIYGGKIQASNATRGDAICLWDEKAQLNVYGGEITKNGDCVVFRSSTEVAAIANKAVTVGGDAKIAEISYDSYVYENKKHVQKAGAPTADTFQIVDVPGDANGQTPFTGSVVLKASNIASTDIVGTISVQLGAGASIKASNGDDLTSKLQEDYDAAGVVLNGQTTSYGTLEEAIARVEDGYVILYRNINEDVTIRNNITIDLNCHNMNNVIVEDGATLTLKDTKKDNDPDYGVVKSFSGNVEPAENYLKITDAEGTSFHAYMMELDTVGLSPENTGMYYKATFDGDATLKSKIESFGVALRLDKAPDKSSMKPGQYTVLDPEKFGEAKAKSAVLVDILKSTNYLSTNKSNAERKIYGRAYIKLTNGDYIFSEVDENQAFSLREFVERYSETSTVEDLAANTAMMELYRKYSAVMSGWEIENIEAAYTTRQAEEANATNILLIGNSSCYYWTDELYGMLDAAGYQKITIYNLYSSGASLEKHYNWWKTDTKECKLLCKGEIIAEGVNINDVWSLRQWDYVSFLQASKVYNYTFDKAMNTITPYFGELLSLARRNAPYAKIFWQESWASDIGFTLNFNMDSPEKQEAMASMIQQVSAQVSKSYGLPVVPLSSAWQSLRNNEDFLGLAAARSERLGLKNITLCTRNIDGQIDNDFDHDGDVGGGQYLNACIFYEMFTGKDCRENTYRPQYVLNSVNYSLTEAEIEMLQEAAHNAVHPNS